MKKNQTQRFSLRKHAVGVASVLLGTVVLGVAATQAAQIIPVLDGVAQEVIETGDAQSDIDTQIDIQKEEFEARGYTFAGVLQDPAAANTFRVEFTSSSPLRRFVAVTADGTVKASISDTRMTEEAFNILLEDYIAQFGTNFTITNEGDVQVVTFTVADDVAVVEAPLRRFVAVTADGTVKASVDTTAMTEETFNILLEEYIAQYGANYAFTFEGDVQVVTFTVAEEPVAPETSLRRFVAVTNDGTVKASVDTTAMTEETFNILLEEYIAQYGTNYTFAFEGDVQVVTFVVAEEPVAPEASLRRFVAVTADGTVKASISTTPMTEETFNILLEEYIAQYGTDYTFAFEGDVQVVTFTVADEAAVVEAPLRRFVAVTTDGTVKASISTTPMTEETFNILLEDYIAQFGTDFVFTYEGDVQVVTFTIADAEVPTPPSSTTEPSTTAPSTTEPSTTAPSTTEPSTTVPSTTEPSTTVPSTTEPSTTAPSTTEPSSTSGQLVLKAVDAGKELPKTGETTATNAVVAGLGLLVAGLGFGLARKKKED